MSTYNSEILTIPQWTAVQDDVQGLSRLLALAQQEREDNINTRAWITVASDEQIQAQWDSLQKRRSAEIDLPLFGVPFAAKDNIDAQSFTTTAACPSFATDAAFDATVVANLKAAGAILIGKTNLDQFATGLVGTRSPYGAVPNSFEATRVSGGSSSGSAVVVARGRVPFSLGTDTAGSGRVPAGLNNIIGLKPTRGAISTCGVVPACRTLDCVSIFALTLDDAELVLSIAEGYDSRDAYSRDRNVASQPDIASFGSTQPCKEPFVAVCAEPPWFDRDDHAPAYEKVLTRARDIGWKLRETDFSLLFALAQLLYEGPWVAERYAAIRSFIKETPKGNMDPTVHKIITKAVNFTAADCFEAEYRRQSLTSQINRSFKDFDVIMVPTSPTFPTLDELVSKPVEENSFLGTYTNFVNFLDWTALSVPAGFRPDGLPFGITLISNKWQESNLLYLARQWLALLPRSLGATGVIIDEPASALYLGQNPHYTPIAVAGAHLTGFPLNKDLTSRGGKLQLTTRTSSKYRLYALPTTNGITKPALKRVTGPGQGAAIQVEVWSLPSAALASFLRTIRSPLGIGSLELADENWVPGFVCEPWALEAATDITEYGGWRSYTKSRFDLNAQVFSSVLIANRGEIALRIIKTLKKMGIRSVTIYSQEDRNSPHVTSADLSLPLEGSSVVETYLNATQILGLAKSASVDAIIPGYGFLAENAEFAAAVEAAGFVWIGPTSDQMAALGLKHSAREVAVKANIPVVPGSEGLVSSVEAAQDEATRIGFPIMVKGTAGGGGIGLRQCTDMESLNDAFWGVQRLSEANFGSSGVFLERFIKRARHIEVQVLGDGNGRVVAVGERDCSLQRRHQKVIEESPAVYVPPSIRKDMRDAAVRLASAVQYRNIGTVEFIFDVDAQAFYFLEMNTRLQVEHPVTELVTGLDLVECMINIAKGACANLFEQDIKVEGAAVEVRLYAESPHQDFRPCSGIITQLNFPPHLRVDTWVDVGTEVTTSYDPLLAKIIAYGVDRHQALKNLAEGLSQTQISGVHTNLQYLTQISQWSLFESGDFTTKSLDTFRFESPSFEVLDAGGHTTVQDLPGRLGYWSIGVPPSGPMDSVSCKLANRLLNNDEGAAVLECTLMGPTIRFHCCTAIAITGATSKIFIDGRSAQMNTSLIVSAGSVLTMGVFESGYRVYVAIRGGIQNEVVMGSRSTFELGRLGGLNGSKLGPGDMVPLDPTTSLGSIAEEALVGSPIPIPAGPRASWSIGVIPGPHGSPEYFPDDAFHSLFESEWTVHHNSNRLGIRLTGPRPQWSRADGGRAGLHPSNIHDSPYSIGSISFTGDEAVALTCDGPSLGGFVVFCVVASPELWKLGQVRPGDQLFFKPVTANQSLRLSEEIDRSIRDLKPLPAFSMCAALIPTIQPTNMTFRHGSTEFSVTARQAGDQAVLLELVDYDDFDIRTTARIAAFCDYFSKKGRDGILEVTAGVQTLHIKHSFGLSTQDVVSRFRENAHTHLYKAKIPSRLVKLPFAFDDLVSRRAVERYATTIRSQAPWLPSNISFLENLNGLGDLSELILNATFLVIGLGDVFLGSPCAVPLDPRHRLFGTKYNPSRSFTPKGSVGIGGQYMCIYAADSPGGYQLVGRTVEIWDRKKVGSGPNTQPWLFHQLDRIQFYPVSEEELDGPDALKLIKIEHGEFDLEQYETWLREHEESISKAAAEQAEAVAKAPFIEELRQKYTGYEAPVVDVIHEDSVLSIGEKVKALVPGRCYKLLVKEGDNVDKGDVLVRVESSKMEIDIQSPVRGNVTAVFVKEGELIEPAQDLIIIGS